MRAEGDASPLEMVLVCARCGCRIRLGGDRLTPDEARRAAYLRRVEGGKQ